MMTYSCAKLFIEMEDDDDYLLKLLIVPLGVIGIVLDVLTFPLQIIFWLVLRVMKKKSSNEDE